MMALVAANTLLTLYTFLALAQSLAQTKAPPSAPSKDNKIEMNNFTNIYNKKLHQIKEKLKKKGWQYSDWSDLKVLTKLLPINC